MKFFENKAIILLRGLPGSGKSTLAKILSEDGKFPVYAIDDYFLIKGRYEFNYKENHLAYDKCRDNVLNAVKLKAKKIFVDNTFTLEWEMEPYFKIASENEYSIFVLTVENYHEGKNVHGISEEQILKMAQKYKIKLMP